jgi:hypothetical protein
VKARQLLTLLLNSVGRESSDGDSERPFRPLLDRPSQVTFLRFWSLLLTGRLPPRLFCSIIVPRHVSASLYYSTLLLQISLLSIVKAATSFCSFSIAVHPLSLHWKFPY